MFTTIILPYAFKKSIKSWLRRFMANLLYNTYIMAKLKFISFLVRKYDSSFNT